MNLFKNRTVMGIICILLSLLICFGVTPLFNKTVTTLGSDIIRLGRSVESLDLSAPVIDSTTQIVVHERKRGHGHKKDDHESQEYKMTM